MLCSYVEAISQTNTLVAGVYTIQQKSTDRYVDGLEIFNVTSLVTRPEQNDNTQQWILNPVTNNADTNVPEGTNGITTYTIGDFTQGGIVFWVDETGQPGLVCAKSVRALKLNGMPGLMAGPKRKGMVSMQEK